MRVFSMWAPESPGFSVDLFVAEPLPFDDLYERATQASVGSIVITVAGIPDLIALKREAGRPIDLEDIRVLEAIASLNDQEPAR